MKESANRTTNDIIRVFISSTFRDMQRERDVMMERVFPGVRRWCEQRGVIWREIDLRWGITLEEAHRGETLRLCLEEVQACYPFFIGLLGERYGYVQKEIDPDLETRFPWLKDFRGRSITEIEIEAGALCQPASSPTVLFYFRDPEFSKKLPATENAADYRSVTNEARKRLDELKRRVEASGHKIVLFSSVQELEKVMTADLLEMLEKRIGASHLGYASDPQWNFARIRGQFLVGTRSWLRTIDSHVMGRGPPLLVTGEVGCGKSAVIAAWALSQIGGDQTIVLDREPWWRQILEQYFDRKPSNIRILPWFVGGIEEREDWRSIAQGLISEINPDETHRDLDKDPLRIRSQLSSLLHQVKERTVLIVDGVDQIRDFDVEAPVSWIPDNLPPQLRMIVSANHPAVVDWARRLHWKVLKLPQWDASRRLNFIVSWFERFGRKLDRGILDQIVAAPQTAEPLYLCTLLEELRMFSSFEELPRKVSAALNTKSTQELYGQMLVRLESIGGTSRVRDLFSFMQVSRRGVTEPELAILLGTAASPLPPAYLSTLLLASREAVAITRGRMRCERIELRKAVAARYLAGGDTLWRERLVEHFTKEPWSRRKVEELPWQLAALARWDALAQLLADFAFLSAPGGLVELRLAWTWLIANAPEFRPEVTYREVIIDPAAHAEIAHPVGSLLRQMGRAFDALPIGQHLLAEARRLNEPEALADALEFLANCLSSTGQFASALALWIELGMLARERRNLVLEARSFAGAGKDLRQLGRPGQALEMWRAEERLCREIGDAAALSACLANVAMLDYKRDPKSGFASLYAHLKTCRLTDDLDGLRRCLGNLGALYNLESKPNKALFHLREEALICRRFRDDEGLQLCLGNQAESQKMLANYDAALELLDDKARICREIGNAAGEAQALLQQAHLFGDKLGAIDAAFERIKKSLEIARRFSLEAIEVEATALCTRLGLSKAAGSDS